MKTIIGVMLACLSVSALAEGGFTVELMTGGARQDSSISGSGDTSGSDSSYGLRGLYEINRHFAAELAYQDYGRTNDAVTNYYTIRVSTTAVTAGVKAIIPTSGKLSLHGRLGLSVWSADLHEQFYSMTADNSDNGNDIYYGIGAQLAFTPLLKGGLEYTITDMDASLDGVSANHEVSNFAVSLSYSF
jgi:hypothetical protein